MLLLSDMIALACWRWDTFSSTCSFAIAQVLLLLLERAVQGARLCHILFRVAALSQGVSVGMSDRYRGAAAVGLSLLPCQLSALQAAAIAHLEMLPAV